MISGRAIQCRPIRESEADEFLGVLCTVFDLDQGLARNIFFQEPLFELERKWALFDSGSIRSVLTTVPLAFGDRKAIGIAGVGTLPEFRSGGLGQRLMEAALEGSARQGEESALLFAKATGLYERCGFVVLDEVVRGKIEPDAVDDDPEILNVSEARTIYDRWSQERPERLRRGERRWNLWKWNLRTCAAAGGGYLCQEGDTVRECVIWEPVSRWPLVAGAEWFGLRSMAALVGVPMAGSRSELLLMGRGFDRAPEMFLTDQF